MTYFPQAEADELFKMKKYRIDDTHYEFPVLRGMLKIPLQSKDGREEFLFDINRRSIKLEKTTFQTRAKVSLILARVDIGGPPHRNPDGEEIACPHIHLYREGYDDKWAYPLPSNFSSCFRYFATPGSIYGTCQYSGTTVHTIRTICMNLKNEMMHQTKNYYRWLEEKTHIQELEGEWVEITTPYLDRHNDYLQLYVKKENDNYLITDDSYIIEDLLSSGVTLSANRQELLKTTLVGFGVYLEGNNLFIKTSREHYPLKLHNFIQAMLSINDLFYLSPSHVSGFFYEDVTNWMDSKNIRYTPKVKFAGKSGYDHMFDFVIPKSKDSPERIVQTINHPQKNSALLLIQHWLDTQAARPADSKLFAFLNDSTHKIASGVMEALQGYELVPVLWSERDKMGKELAA